MHSVDVPIHDIAPLVEIVDYSFYYFLAAVIIGSTLLAAAAIWVLKRMRNRRIDERKAAFEKLKTIDLRNPKQAAYDISEIGRRFAGENERTQKAFDNLFGRLERYKYAREVDPIDEETLGYYRLYLEIIDV